MITRNLVIFTLMLLQCSKDIVKAADVKPSYNDTIFGTESKAGADTLTNTKNALKYRVSTAAIVTSKGTLPFWMRSNQYGGVPLSGVSAVFAAETKRDYDTKERHLLDWGFGAEGQLNVGNRTQALLIQAYIKGKLGIFQLQGGRSRDIMGLVDSTLSSGSFSISGNALGVPKVELSIPEYWSIPILGKILAVKGNFAHGWLGNQLVDYARGDTIVNTFLHQKSFYARLGKPSWRLKIIGGFNHQAFWGSEIKQNPENFTLSTLQTYRYVVFGQSYGERGTGLSRSKVGNHMGSIDQAFQYDFDNSQITGYHQFFYEVGGLYHLNNIKDGLWGLKYSNNRFRESSSNVRLKKILFEFMNSKSQGGEIDAKITPSGDEDYYNNYLYPKGWTYNGENLGNPLFTSKKYARKNLPAINEYFTNNRIQAFHLGLDAAVSSFSILCKLTFSKNYGTYGTSPWGHSLNTKRTPGKPPYFERENQFSGYIEASKSIRNINFSLCAAMDQGSMLYNASGLWFKVSRSW
ncbi:capsule assembly Wzi family protein [Dyadobacter alkalitolerans]|uniref:capsule assembly Wzi family protein n=1 Tax=Dyadobacter alkalitolerans TaxID=492736 RepID=UPI000403C410|nr:capsule assembly Wzi family protein [Dyadobacter alkalitolerans]